MKKVTQWLVFGVAGYLISGCATPLNSMQTIEYKSWKSKGVLVEEKSPSTAAALGILPGGGSFYTGNTGLGIVNLLCWPASILWDPVSGSDGAKSINYYATKASLDKKKGKELSELNDKLTTGSVKNQDYIRLKQEIEVRYSTD
ncbi:MAG: hypothetical protein NT163_06950 [Chlorobiales bacterium]|nr:hypothetical protein [Chlorobiales bacterium]